MATFELDPLTVPVEDDTEEEQDVNTVEDYDSDIEEAEEKKEEEIVLQVFDDDEIIDDQTVFEESKQLPEDYICNKITKYEKAAIIGYRAQQIAEGAEIYTEIGNLKDASEIAEKEWNENKIPLIIYRMIPGIKLASFIEKPYQIKNLLKVD